MNYESLSPERLEELEKEACEATPPSADQFNRACVLPDYLTLDSVGAALREFSRFLTFINLRLHQEGVERIETIMSSANFSSMVGEYMVSNIPKQCSTIAKNRFHNGHPDLIPDGEYPGNSIKHGEVGVEVKSSRNASSWQGHNSEASWLLMFHYESNRGSDDLLGIPPMPFRVLGVYGAQLEATDWSENPRNPGSKRTATASVLTPGREKMRRNWLYEVPGLELKNAIKRERYRTAKTREIREKLKAAGEDAAELFG